MKLLLWVGGAYAGLALLLYFAQRSLIYLPPNGTAGTAEVERLEVASATLGIVVRRAPGPGALIYFGGNAEDVAWSLTEIAEAFPGRSLFLPYYRGYGPSTGKPSESVLHSDALALFDRLRNEHSDVVVVGRSLGSGVATRLASLRPVSCLVLVTPFDSLLRVAQRQFPILPVSWLLRDRYESSRWAPEIDARTLLIAAEHDELVPRSRTEALLAAFRPGRAELAVVPGADHNSIAWLPAGRAFCAQTGS